MKNLTGKQIVCILIGLLIGIYAYNFPMQRIRAEKAVNAYMEMQGADTDKIKSCDIKKDWTQNGHKIFIEYEDDPGKIYAYHYKKDGSVNLIVYDLKWDSITYRQDVKYPVLPQEYWLYQN